MILDILTVLLCTALGVSYFWKRKKECSECDSTDDVILVCQHCIMERRQKDVNKWYNVGLQKGREDAIQKGQVNLTPRTIKRLIMLCHPDKHNNSEESNLATKWLLEQRNKRS